MDSKQSLSIRSQAAGNSKELGEQKKNSSQANRNSGGAISSNRNRVGSDERDYSVRSPAQPRESCCCALELWKILEWLFAGSNPAPAKGTQTTPGRGIAVNYFNRSD